MPEEAVWTLIVSLVVLAIGATLKWAGCAHSLKLANEEIARLGKQIEMLQEKNKNLTSKASKPNPVSARDKHQTSANSIHVENLKNDLSN